MRTAIVTGASRGIGAAASLELSALGYAVAVNFKDNAEKAFETVSKIRALGGVAEAFKADVSEPDEVRLLFQSSEEALGRTEILVNNAGISKIALLQDMGDDEISELLRVDLLGTILCSREAAKLMIPRKSGLIINIASMWGEVGASCETVYSACKAGVIGFTKALAKELGPSGIRVNCVSPGVIRTDMNSALDAETLGSLESDTPLLRLGTPKDVAKAIAFFAREDSSFITGQVLPVNGGIIV